MNSPTLRAESSYSDGQLEVTLTGEIDILVEENIVSRVTAAITQSNPLEMVLDLRAVTFMDSSGLRAVLRCQRIAESEGVRFRVGVAEGPVTRLFAVAGVAEWFDRE